jgi:hypothetical protein
METKVKKGDYVLAWSDESIDVGIASEDQNEDGEFDLDFIGGGSMSPAGPEAVVIPKSVAIFIDAATKALPVDPADGLHKPKEWFLEA